jgi:hypothetical protein
MKSDERIFRHSLGKLALMSLGVLVLGYTAYVIGTADYFLMALAGIAFVIVLLYATSSVALSTEGITTKRLFGSKSLRWTEIGRVSMRGQALRLHNRDEDMILSIDSQLEDYKEILDIIFSKRPDLLDESNNTVITASWLSHFLILGFGLFIVAGSVWLFSVFEESSRIYALLFLGLGLFIMGSWFLSPKRIALEDKTLLLIYLFRQVSYTAEEISSISLEKTRTRNGYIYFVQINLASGKKIKLPTFEQGTTLTYQILKKWHERALFREKTILHDA